jgi:uncharacterized protein
MVYASKYNLIFDALHKDSYLILNPLSGGMDLFDSRGAYLLKHPDEPGAQASYPQFFGHCREQGYLYDTPTGEDIRLKRVWEESNKLYEAEPLRVEIYPTFLCNLRCTYCFQSQQFHTCHTITEPQVVVAMFAAIARFQRSRGNAKVPILTLFGGEPLLKHKAQQRLIKTILDLSRVNGYRLRIITNGVHLSAYADLLSQYDIDFIQVTLDGPQQVHDKRRVFAGGRGSFKYVVEGIDSALARRLRIVVRVNIDRDNVASLSELADFILGKQWLDKGALVGVAPVDEFVPEAAWCAEQTKIDTLRGLLEVRRHHPQTAFMAISYRLIQFFEYVVENGRLPSPMIKYCPATMGNQISMDYLGNIFACCCMNCCKTKGLGLGRFYPSLEIDEKALAVWTNRDVRLLPTCQECSLALLCGGGCSRLVAEGAGDLRKDVICPPMMNLRDLQVLVGHYLPRIMGATRVLT